MNRREYLKHSALIFGGSSSAQLLNLASYPLLARLYSPADFGVFATFVAAAAVVGVLACARFDRAIPTAPRWGRFAILWLCVAVSIAVGIISIAGSAVYFQLLEGRFQPLLSLLFGLCVFLTGFCTSATLYLMRHDRYRMSSISVFVRTAATLSIQLGMAIAWRDPLSLIVGFIGGLAVQAFVLAATIRAQIPLARPRQAHMRALFARYKRQVLIDIPSALVGAVSLNLMTLILISFYGQRTAGFYAVAQRIAILPMQLLNDALAQVFFQKAARAQEQRGHFWDEMRFNLLTSGLIAVCALGLIYLFARPVAVFYLGTEWAPTADMLIVLAPMLAMRSIAMSIATAALVLRRPHWLLIHNLASVACFALAGLIAYFFEMNVMGFLYICVGLLTLESAAFALFLALRTRAAHAASIGS